MTANCKLNNLEYLALKMVSTPGQSGRFYLKALYKYRFPLNEQIRGNFCPQYFAPSGKYFDKLWIDVAEARVPFVSYASKTPRPKSSSLRGCPQHAWQLDHVYLKPTSSEWYLTQTGFELAVKAATKIGADISRASFYPLTYMM